jgi:hypothetical protein
MTSVFVFALIVGGGLLALSLLGDLFGAGDADFDTDLGTDLDLDTDLSIDTDVAIDGDLGLDTDMAVDDMAPDAAAASGELSTDLAGAIRIFTIRNLTYFLFGFGAMGWLVALMRPDLPVWAVTAVAVLAGSLTAGIAAVVFGWVRATDSGWQAEEASFVGCEARVVLPVHHGKGGQIMVRRGDREHELRALPFDTRAVEPERWRSVVVIEMDGGTARVSPMESLAPAEDGPANL